MPDLPKFVWVLFGCLPQFQRTESRWYWHSMDGDGRISPENRVLARCAGHPGSSDPGMESVIENHDMHQRNPKIRSFTHITNTLEMMMPNCGYHCVEGIKKPGAMPGLLCDPYENRTRDSSVKGRRLNRLTNGPCLKVCKDKTLRYFIKIFHERILYFYIPGSFTACCMNVTFMPE